MTAMRPVAILAMSVATSVAMASCATGGGAGPTSRLPAPEALADSDSTIVKGLPRPRDSALGIDKLKHFLMAGFVESVAFAGLEASGAGRNTALAAAGATAIAVSFGREYHDRKTTGFSFGDLLWDTLGAGATFLMLTRVQR